MGRKIGMLNNIKWHKIHGLSETADYGGGVRTGFPLTPVKPKGRRLILNIMKSYEA
ncbi:hypothetical protein [Metallosphaera yellowstonensis]|uniref:hypothetical protein n=1 Tax=Metallosphaera yellowstonensis TaxID=1111107 RepID=UPI000AB106AE|nr:hypothetical protein [Metallosphaera yellowstonensis]